MFDELVAENIDLVAETVGVENHQYQYVQENRPQPFTKHMEISNN